MLDALYVYLRNGRMVDLSWILIHGLVSVLVLVDRFLSDKRATELVLIRTALRYRLHLVPLISHLNDLQFIPFLNYSASVNWY